MSYAAYYTRVGISAPQGFGVMVAAWLAINVYNGKPTFYTKQISKAEFNATPLNYLQSPEHNQKAFPKVPGQTTVPDGLAELQHRVAHSKGAHH